MKRRLYICWLPDQLDMLPEFMLGPRGDSGIWWGNYLYYSVLSNNWLYIVINEPLYLGK